MAAVCTSNLPSYQKSKPERKLSSRKVSIALLDKAAVPSPESSEGPTSHTLFSKETVYSVNERDLSEDFISANPEGVDNAKVLQPLNSHYASEKLFEDALDLFNKELELYQGMSGYSIVSQRWECRGKIRVSFQLCVLCRDVGKVRSHTDKYYLDVMEVRKHRTVLCQGCLACVVHRYFAKRASEMEERCEKQ